ncbi:hypothetical protein IG631_14877 [Alternaria alternata]|nr:hypothetical protein IG631_14877 [Alternaria alternata]
MGIVGALLFVKTPPPKTYCPDSQYFVKSRPFVFHLSRVHCLRKDDGRLLLYNVEHSIVLMAVVCEVGEA